MKRFPVFSLLAAALALGLAACGYRPSQESVPPVSAAVQSPEAVPVPTPEPAPFRVEGDDVPLGEYAPWQEGYADFLRVQRQQEGELKEWVDTASSEELNEDLERWSAYSLSSEYYSFYDVDEDGVPELFVRYGDCEAAYHTVCYAFREGEVVEVGDFPSGHSCLYTCPGENGVLYYWGHMGRAFLQKLLLRDGELAFAEDFYQEWGGDGEGPDPDPASFVPGAEYIWEYRTPTHWRAGDCPALTLPIYDYGVWPRRLEGPLDDGEVRATIGKVLWEGAELFGVSGDGFYGDTGVVTLEEYLAPGAAYPYNDQSLVVTEYAWADVNGDWQTDCVLRLEGDGSYYTVLSLQEGTVYAYFLGFTDGFGVDPDGTVFLRWYDWWEQVSFYKNQCYTFSAPREPVEGCDLAWEGFVPRV